VKLKIVRNKSDATSAHATKIGPKLFRESEYNEVKNKSDAAGPSCNEILDIASLPIDYPWITQQMCNEI
jgi:hypothetical protein